MKRILCLLMTALLTVGVLSLFVLATDDTVVFIAHSGNDADNGLTATTPKKSLGKMSGTGAMSLLKHGGTLVTPQKLYVGSDYTWELPDAVTITASHGGTDYKNPEPASNPATGVMKMASGVTLTVKSELTIDDIILFQEANQNTIVVADGGKLTITDKVVCMSARSYYLKIEVQDGGTAVINGGIFSQISGEGEITVAEGVTVLNSGDTLPKPSNAPSTGSAEVAFIRYGAENGNSGLTPDAPKGTFGNGNDSGVMSLLKNGGKLVVVGKAYIGTANYTMPTTSTALTITSV